MPLTAGARLGPYEIIGAIGAGGMGQVYKARDTRLGREVALKVLAAELASDNEFRERFEREARSISALDHPNICTLYDVGHESATHFLVMQYLDGETLATRLEKGPLPIDQAVKTAIEICDALDKAHRHGIIHRDLKPGNIMLTSTGAARSSGPSSRPGSSHAPRSGSVQAKLLDFGLAKTAQPQVASSAAATIMAAPHAAGHPLTARGTILGTFEYMSPEQIEGQEADTRSDIWAFGCVLYEMLTGKRAFEGKSRASLVGAILKEQAPRVAAVQPLAPAGLDHVISTCLAKDPDDRWQSAADIARELQWVAASPPEVAAPAAPVASHRRERLGWIAALVLAVAATAAGVWFLKPSRAIAEAPVVHAMLPFASAETLQVNQYPTMALSLDGRNVAYRGGSPPQIYVRALAEAQSKPISGTEGGAYPFFSPDGGSLGFLVGRSIKRISLGGGAPVPIVDLTTTSLRGVAWGDDGYIYYTPTVSAGLWRIPAAGGGQGEQLTTPDFAKGEKTHRFPFVLPGSKAVLFMVGTSRITSFDDARIEVLSLTNRTRHALVDGGIYPQYATSGHLLYVRDGKLVAVPFNPDRLELAGAPVTTAEGMFSDTVYGLSNYAVSRDGMFVRVSGGAVTVAQRLVVVDRQGVVTPAPTEPAFYSTARVSPDGKQSVTFMAGATSQIEVHDLVRGSSTRLTYEWDNENPCWSPDGSRLVFASNRGGGARNLYTMRSSDGADVQRLVTSPNDQQPFSWSADGVIAYVDFSPTSGGDIYTVSAKGGTPKLLVGSPAEETSPMISPDGRWIAYQSNQSGQPEIYVQSFPAGGSRTKVSNGGGAQPLWQRSGHELIYRRGPAIMAVAVTTTPDFHAGVPGKLFDSTSLLSDVFLDGKLLMRTTSPLPPVTELEIVVNWFQELKTKVGK